MQQGNIIKLPRVSVLMATYNGINYLDEQIMSILSQKGVIISLFISDDCSDDNTVGLLERYKKKYDNIFIVSKNKKFGSAARNFLSLLNDHDATKFDYIALADQDDIWLDSKIYRSINCFNKLNTKYGECKICYDNDKLFKCYKCNAYYCLKCIKKVIKNFPK